MKKITTNTYYFNVFRQSTLTLLFFIICNSLTAQVYTYVAHNINTTPATVTLAKPCGGIITVYCQDPSLPLWGSDYTFNGCYLMPLNSNCQRMGLATGGCIPDPCCSGSIDNDNDGISDLCDLDDDNDGILDTDEVVSGPCAVIISDDFENGSGSWIDGGVDAMLYSNANYANSGAYSYRLRDDSDSLSAISTGNLNFNSSTEVRIAFSYYPRSMEAGENFFVEISTDGGTTYSTVKQYFVDTDFVNNTRYFEDLTIIGPFTNTTRFRIRNNASSNGDYIYVDDIVISDCSSVTFDIDGDGISNSLDLDSDGDGCPDAIESGANFTNANTNANGQLTGAVDANGIPTIATSNGQTIGSSQNAAVQNANCADPCDPAASGNIDTDGDGIADVCDLDDDNDGISDTDECAGSATNIALNGTAIQSTIDHGGLPSRAIDGNTNGSWPGNSITHSATSTNPYWSLDLGSQQAIDEVVVWNRTDCCTGRLDDFTLEIKDNSNNTVFTYTHQGSVNTSVNIPVTGNGRYVKISLSGSGRTLSLAEVQVFSTGCGDYDSDGIADYLDIDSDNDGCPDALEGGANFDFSQIQNDSTLIGSINSDGIPTIANGGQGVGTSQNNAQQSLACICVPANLDTTIINLTTCDANLAGTVNQTLTNQAGCDSLIITNTTFNGGPNTTIINLTTCDASLAGTVNQTLTNQAGCDSLIITNTTFNGGPSTTNLTVMTCDPNAAGVITQDLTAANGCDSTVITTTIFNGGPNTTIINLTTCDASLAGTVNQTLTNQAGCDSLIITNTTFNGGPSTTIINQTTCNLNSVGLVTETLTAANGCDSLVYINTVFNGGPDTTVINLTTCDANLAGTVDQTLTNQAGCDSLIITNTTFNGGSDTTTLNLITCDVNLAGTTTRTLMNQAGCDSLVITNIILNTVQAQAQCPGFRTQTQGGWGAGPNGNNPGVYLHANFANAFPNGLIVGCNNTLTLTSAQAVTDFLPSGGGPQALSANFVNPTSNKGTFAAQVVALTISVNFDSYDVNFGSSSYNLKDLIIQSGPFTSWTVQQLLTEANLALGGCPSSYSRSDLNNAVDNVNNSYVDGNASGSFLGCPPCISLTHTSVNPSCALAFDGSIDLTVSGGVSPYSFSWSNGTTTEDLTNVATGVYLVTVTDDNGITGVETVTLTAPLFINPTITKVDNIGLDNDFQDTRSTAFGDYDGDGYVDMFVPNYRIDSTSFLYHNNGDGTFTKVTDANNPIVTDLAPSTSGVWGDYDNDGDIDLFVTNNIGYGNFLYRNEGNGVFVSILSDPIVNYIGYSHGAAWADYDNDGYLDMFIADFFSTRFNKLYHNNGDGTFREVLSSPLVTDASFSVSAVWGDYDNDRDQDLFVANTNGENNFLYRNDGNGNFTKITSGVIVNDGGKSTGASWGDYDNDLDLDLFVANAGNENNFLYRNNGDGTFTKITNSVISSSGGHSHGSTWGDMDNNGYIDLIVGNDQGGNNNMFLNNGDGTFTALNNDVTQDGGKSFGLALADIDNDCDLDLHVSNIIDEANAMYLNDLAGCNKKVCFTLVGTSANALAYGAKVKILATINGVPTWQMRELASLSGGGFGGQNDSRVMFGVGDAAQVDSVYIEWASGFVQKLGPVAVNTCVCQTITEQNGSVVSGSIYFDGNIDCSYNGTDEGLEGIEIVAQPGNIKTYTDIYGDYAFNLAPGVYTITQTNTNIWTASCSTDYTINVAAIGQQYPGNDFANTTSCPNPDLYIDLSTTALRVGFENLYAITFGNNGAVAANNATVKVDFGVHILPLSASLPWDSKSGTEYTWNIGMIQLGQEFTIYIEDSVLTTATIGDNLVVLGTINESGSTANDCDATNNIEIDINLAVGAIDPNDILVSPEGFIANDQELTYKIRFQNIGNDLVNRVVLRDELPEGLDISTLVRGVASHAYQFRIEGKRTLVWEFSNINLLDSTTNEPESHGFATFRITPQIDLPDGTELPNKAAIFFDNSDPIITNTVINTIGEPTNVKPGDVAIYPNPMTNFTTIRILPRQLDSNEEEIQSIEIYTMLGHQVLSMNGLTGTRVMIERGELPSGYYIVKVKSNKGVFYIGKLLVQE